MIEAWRGDDPRLKKQNQKKWTIDKIQKLLEATENEHLINKGSG